MSSYSTGGFGSSHNYDWTGKLINDNYILIKRLGYGSFAAVWLCYSLKHKKCCAVKILNPEDYISGMKEIFVLQKMNKLGCPYIINILDHFTIPVQEDLLMNNSCSDSDDERLTEDDRHVCIVLELMLCSVYDILKMY